MRFLLQLGSAKRGLQGNHTAAGTRYWTFPPDYPERVAAVIRDTNEEDTQKVCGIDTRADLWLMGDGLSPAAIR
jgi:hypothetical protein